MRAPTSLRSAPCIASFRRKGSRVSAVTSSSTPHRLPELLATGPNQLWTWDITKLLGPAKWTYYYLYVILDVFSRYAVDWMIAERELAVLAQKLIKKTIAKQSVDPNKLTIHADRGSSMTSNRWRCCLPTSASSSRTRARTSPTTTATRSRSSRRSNTGRASRSLRVDPGRALLLCLVLSLVQRRPPALRDRDDDPCGDALRPCPGAPRRPPSRSYHRVRGLPERFPKGPLRPWKLPTAAWINPPEIRSTTEEVTH